MEEEIEIPSHFLCPISLQLMRDPVTVSTGITYDRANIERWLFTCKNNTCPVTKQVLSMFDDHTMTPNHTLRRLIQSWCTANASNGIERIPTPQPPVDKSQIAKILKDASKSPSMQLACLRRLRSITLKSERNRICLETSGAVEFLAKIIMSYDEESQSDCDEALSILYHLNVSESCLKNIVSHNNGDRFLESLARVLKRGSSQSRSYAIAIVRMIYEVAAEPRQLISADQELFNGTVDVLRDREQISQQALKAALKLLLQLCPWGRNRIKAVESDAVLVLINLLIDVAEKRVCELVLTVLDQLCRCAEGRAELLKHGAGLAVVSKKILRVSHVASDRAVRILGSVCKFSATVRVVQEMLQVGVVAKLCLVLQVDAGAKTQDRAREILKLNARAWRDSPCIPAHLLSSYPSS